MPDKRLYKEIEFQNERAGKYASEERINFYDLIDFQSIEFKQNLMKQCKNKDVLVLGCSSGEIVSYAKSGAKSVVAIDISFGVIQILKNTIAEEGIGSCASALIMSAEELGFRTGSFDIVCGSGIIHHLDIQNGMREVARVLRDNGVACFREPLGLHPLVNWYRKTTPDKRSAFEHPLLPGDFAYFRSLFNNVEIQSAGLTSIAALVWVKFIKNRYLYKISKYLLTALDRVFLAVFPFLKYWCWACIINLRKSNL